MNLHDRVCVADDHREPVKLLLGQLGVAAGHAVTLQPCHHRLHESSDGRYRGVWR